MQRRYAKILFLLFISLSGSSLMHGQNRPKEIPNDSLKLKLYMDCHDCDFAYFRRNLGYVDFVRDPKLSDVHLLVTEQRTGSNGRAYGFNFIGSGQYSDLNYKLNTVSLQSDTDIQIWERLLKTTSMGLMPYISRTTEVANLDIIYTNDSLDNSVFRERIDSWNYWVFRINYGADLEFEESLSEISNRASLRLDRITNELKIRSDISYFRSSEKYHDNGEIIVGLREEIDSDIEAVFSLDPRWSLGVFSEIRSSTYQNTDLAYRLGPAIEYNVFPWDESDRRIFSFGYHIQAHYFNYQDITIYDYMEEFRTSESLRVSLILRQPWGEIDTELEGSHYFHDFSKNRLTLESRISINITKGLSIYSEIDAGLIHDQLNLPAGQISREDLLLKQRQLASTYSFSAEFGINFTFGSIYNNIVNQRL